MSSAEDLAVEALGRAVADPIPRPMHGTKARPGIFVGSTAATKAAAALCLQHGWLKATEQFQGRGKSAKELFRIAPAGTEYALRHGPANTLLSDLLSVADVQRDQLQLIDTQLKAMLSRLDSQHEALMRLHDRLQPPDLSALMTACGSSSASASESDWWDSAVSFVRNWKTRKSQGMCPLPELFHAVVQPQGVSIGLFHDGLRELVRQGRLRLHPYTGPMYQLHDEQFALLMGQEIRFYADSIA